MWAVVLELGVKTLHIALLALFFVSTAVDLRAVEGAQPNREATEAKPAPELAGDVDDVASLIKELDHDEFLQREAAGKKLAEMGAIAIPALAEVTKGKSPEVSMRAFDIIVRHYKGGDEEVKKTAASALQKIVKSGKSFAARAKQTLDFTKPAPRVGVPFRARIVGNAGIKRRVAVSIQNGVKQVAAEEDGRQIKIFDDPQKGIKVEVTEEKEGKKETRKYEAESVDELKEKHPEAHRLYQQYAGNIHAGAGNVRIRLKAEAP